LRQSTNLMQHWIPCTTLNQKRFLMSMKIPKYPKHTPAGRWDMIDGIVFDTSSFMPNIALNITSVQPMSITMTGMVFDDILIIPGKPSKKP